MTTRTASALVAVCLAGATLAAQASDKKILVSVLDAAGAPVIGVTASDFVESWRRVLTPSLGAENAGLLYVLRGAEAFHKGATTDFGNVGVKATAPETLRVVLEHPTPYFLSLLTHAAWLPVPSQALINLARIRRDEIQLTAE